MSTSVELTQWREHIDRALHARLPQPDDQPQSLHRAMHHAVMLGGKRMRPLLTFAAARAIDPAIDLRICEPAAAAVEFVHAYSLVHDDLPAMDDDSLRRGQPTVHVAFDEATAVLTGDALQTLAFESIADADWDAPRKVAVLQSLAKATGARGMCGGQAIDIDATGQLISLQTLRHLHSLKTGALIVSAVEMGALLGGATSSQLRDLSAFAADLGLAFQIQDDILDVEGDAATLGKTAGKDAEQDKSTFPSLIGMEASREWLAALSSQMQKALEPFGPGARMLQALADLAIRRNH